MDHRRGAEASRIRRWSGPRAGRAAGARILFSLPTLAVLSGLGWTVSCADPPPRADLAALYGVAAVPPGGVEIETGYSQVRIRDEGTVRSLYFVAGGKREVVESRMDLARPEALVLPYTRTMFASYLFVPEPERVLLVGLGAGSMVRFLAHHDPQVLVDVLEIDPAIVAIAEEYFGTRAGEGVHFQVADGYEVLRTAEERWDVIYMDAFLEPSEEETDRTGLPLRLKETPFYEALRRRLVDGGVVVLNLIGHRGLDADVAGIRGAFGSLALLRTRGSNNVIVVASRDGVLPEREILERNATAADERLAPATWTFRSLLPTLDFDPPRRGQ